MQLRTLIILAAVGFIGWKMLNPDPEKARSKAGLMPSDVAMFSISGCESACGPAFQEARKRNLRVVQFDVETQPGKALWESQGSPNRFPLFLVQHRLVEQQNLRAEMVHSFGSKALTVIEQRFFKPHFGAGDRPKAVIYMASWCGYCRALREELQRSKTDFVEIDVEGHANRTQLSEIMGIGGYPTVYVGVERLNGAPAELAQRVRELLKRG